MKIVCLIACSNKKLNRKDKAKLIYQGTLFKKSYRYSEYVLKADNIYILSAKYGLLNPNEIIEPYNITLNTMNKKTIQEWSNKVFSKLKEKEDINNTMFIFLAGEKYRKYLINKLKYFKIPMEHCKGIGYQLQFLTEELNNSIKINNF